MNSLFTIKTITALITALLLTACAREKQTEVSWKTNFDDAKYLDIQQDYDKAKKQYKLALAKLPPTEEIPDWRAEILARLARLEVIGGNLDEANKLADEALKLTLDQKAQGENHGEVLIAIDDLAEAYSERSYKAKSDRASCLAMAIKLLDGPFKRPSKVLSRSRVQLAVIYLVNGEKQKAEPLAKILIERAKATKTHRSLRELAAGYKIAGDEKRCKEILAIEKSLLKEPGREGPMLALFTGEVAKLYAENGKYEEAAKTITDLEEKIKPKKLTAAFYEQLATIYEAQRKLKEADASFEDALAVDRPNPAHRKDLRKRMEAYARYLRRTHREKKADEMQAKADALRDQNF